jgi:class 3 adenylate cyclase
MSWDSSKAEERIKRFMANGPSIEAGLSVAKSTPLAVFAKRAADAKEFPHGRATLVEGAHLYGLLLDFEQIILQDQRETEGSHARVLQFLDVHYRVWDALVEEGDAIRVDYHGARMHAVVTEPKGNPTEQIRQAIALASKLNSAAKRVAAQYGFPARVRFGIDQGHCLAMTTGRSHETDVLFLGSPANHAAKLTAAGRQPGIFLTDGAKQKLISGRHGSHERFNVEELALSASQQYRFAKFEGATERLAGENRPLTIFKFQRTSPPLSSVKFSDLSPSKSIRMGMASMFADIDGYTRYVDAAIQSGEAAIRDAVRSVHVLREELNSVLKEDFGGKRVRFIGDCIQGVIAEGKHQDDPRDSVKSSALCASGMRSSFTVAQRMLKTIDALDLAIGVEYGPIPITRLGSRGTESVRCAAALTVTRSEKLQQDIKGGGIIFGPNALACADNSLRNFFGGSEKLPAYSDAATLFSGVASPSVQIMLNDASARPHARNV